MWPQLSHLLALLIAMTFAKAKLKWTSEHQESFDKMKALMARETLVTFRTQLREKPKADPSAVRFGTCYKPYTRR